MNCAWKELMAILPSWLSQQVDNRNQNTLQELRLRLNQPPQLICKDQTFWLSRDVTVDDLNFCINTASRYSPWSAQSAAHGYITAPGGHRIGLCGDAVMSGGSMTGIRTIRSVCIRVARDFPGIAVKFANYSGSILLIGPPGSGKTTLLRDLIRQISLHETVAVVDERCELFPNNFFQCGKALDILSACPKTVGIDILLRTMGPDTIAVDEITAATDCNSLIHAAWCGVRLLATAHAASLHDLQQRDVYAPLIQKKLFQHIFVLNRDKTVRDERMEL